MTQKMTEEQKLSFTVSAIHLNINLRNVHEQNLDSHTDVLIRTELRFLSMGNTKMSLTNNTVDQPCKCNDKQYKCTGTDRSLLH
jgi:hypothetical protein